MGAGTVQVVRLGFEVLRVDLPVDSIRHSRKVWNHVDELRMDPDLAARLARNGVRLGVGSRSSWPAIRAVLDAAGAGLRQEQMLPQGDAGLIIELAAVPEDEVIFRYGANNRLVGKNFSGGTKRVKLDYAYRPGLGGCTDLQVGLEICHNRGTMTWERRDGVVRQVPEVDRHVFEDLVTELTLGPEEFLIIGPGDQADQEFLVGGRFFTYQQDGERFEMLLCITPQAYRADRTGT